LSHGIGRRALNSAEFVVYSNESIKSGGWNSIESASLFPDNAVFLSAFSNKPTQGFGPSVLECGCLMALESDGIGLRQSAGIDGSLVARKPVRGGTLSASALSSDLLCGRPAWAQVDLGAIAFNVKALRRVIGPNVELIAVVKANAYGHGVVPVARTCLSAGASRLVVACVDEGIELRKAGISAPILVMGWTPPWDAGRVLVNQLTVTVDRMELARALSHEAAARSVNQPIHFKVDTGMGRFGLLPEETVGFIEAIRDLPGLGFEGVFTHLARSEETDAESSRRQLNCFNEVLADLAGRGIKFAIRHAANTAAALMLPESRFDAVRCGIGLFGLHPAPTTRAAVELKPAMQIMARLARVARLPKGSAIGYGGTHVLQRDTMVGLVPLGYADGVPRALSNCGSVLIGGRRALIVGRVSMDQLSVNVEGIDAKVGDEVVILGSQGNETIPAEELAEHTKTIHYEIVTGIPPRLPRVYVQDGGIVEVQTLLGRTCPKA
jgi:alanine racemase